MHNIRIHQNHSLQKTKKIILEDLVNHSWLSRKSCQIHLRKCILLNVALSQQALEHVFITTVLKIPTFGCIINEIFCICISQFYILDTILSSLLSYVYILIFLLCLTLDVCLNSTLAFDSFPLRLNSFLAYSPFGGLHRQCISF